jgi:hypothetical protein
MTQRIWIHPLPIREAGRCNRSRLINVSTALAFATPYLLIQFGAKQSCTLGGKVEPGGVPLTMVARHFTQGKASATAIGNAISQNGMNMTVARGDEP